MKTLLSIILILFTIKAFGQINLVKNVLNIKGYTIDELTKDTIPFTLVELVINNEIYFITKTDFDGHFTITMCNDKIKTQKAELIFTMINYEQKKILLNNFDTFQTNYFLRPDPKKEFNKAKIDSYSWKRIEECGTERIINESALNRLYQHCDGRIKRYNDIDDKENMILWTPIE